MSSFQWIDVQEREPDEAEDAYPDGGGFVLVSNGECRALVLACHDLKALGWRWWLPVSALPMPQIKAHDRKETQQ